VGSVGFLQRPAFFDVTRVLLCGVERFRPPRVFDYHIARVTASAGKDFGPCQGAFNGGRRIPLVGLVVLQGRTPFIEEEKSIAVLEKISKAGIAACGQVMTDARVRLVQNDKAKFPYRHSEIDVDEVDRIKLFIKSADEIP
jgi:hypothetical protein